MGNRNRSALLECHNLVDAPLVTTPSERRRQEGIDDVQGIVDRRCSSAEGEHIRVVVLSA